MNIQVFNDPPMDLLASIEQDISRGPRSSVTTILCDQDYPLGIAYIAATVSGEPAGAALLRFLGDGGVELHKIVVVSRFRRRGVASQLFNAAVSRCRQEGVKSLVFRPLEDSFDFWDETLQHLPYPYRIHDEVKVIEIDL
ncbi:GNAT family N-acetyltransferase [Stenotrophomonas maltophilia]|nr:GNAT family N-acetyltransferase [Stenotrophomonas maltophilia]